MSESQGASSAQPTPVQAAAAEIESSLSQDQEISGQESVEEQIEEIQESEELSAKEKKEAVANLKKKLKLKVDGKEVEREIDLNDEEGLKKELQKAMAFEKRAQEVATMKSQLSDFFAQLKKNPASILPQLGINLEELSEAVLQQKVEEMKKSPEQLEKEKMQKELEEYRAQLEEQKRQAEMARLEQLKNQYASEIETDIQEALSSGKTVLPKSPLVIQRIAQTLYLAAQKGRTDLRAADVIPVVEKQFRQELSQMFDILPEETLEMLVGQNNLERLRKKRVKATKPAAPTASQVAKTTGSSKKTEEAQKPKEKPKFKDIFKNIY